MRMTTPDHTKWMVGICAKVFPRDQISRSELIWLKDPSTGEQRQYVLVQNRNDSQMIVEIQNLGADFSSFLVGRHVVKDGTLYVLSEVDPLFFVLRDCTISKQPSKWQPLDQTLECLVSDKLVRGCVQESQLGHLFQTLCNDQTDNVAYFKFCESKALGWLQRKQERVYQCLLQQETKRRERFQRRMDKRPVGSFGNSQAGSNVSSTFYMPEDPMAAMPSTERTETICTKQFKLESLQIICNYLSDEWTEKLIASLEVSYDHVFVSLKPPSNTVEGSTTHSNPASLPTTTPAKVTPNPKKIELTRLVANRRLEKINKRGMSALTTFFGPVKKKRATTEEN